MIGEGLNDAPPATERERAEHEVTLWVEGDGTTTGVCRCGWGYASPDLHAFADALAGHLKVPAFGSIDTQERP